MGSLNDASFEVNKYKRQTVEGVVPSWTRPDRCAMYHHSDYKSYLVDPASSRMLVSKIKPCM